jgi:hypothetical protein
MKSEIGYLPRQFFLKALTPLGILAKTSGTPSPGFSTRVHLCTVYKEINFDDNVVLRLTELKL